jgi:hypothetical protein
MSASRTTRVVIAIAIVAVIGIGVGAYYALGTPQYSLLMLGRAMERGDGDAMMRFIDVDSLTQDAMDAQLETLRAKESDNPREQMQTSIQVRQMQLNSAMFHGIISGMMRGSLEGVGSGGAAADAPALSLKGVTYSDDLAHVELAREGDEGGVLGFDMRQQPNRRWKIVHADMQQLAGMMQ